MALSMRRVSRSLPTLLFRAISNSTQHSGLPRASSSSQCMKILNTPNQCSWCLNSPQCTKWKGLPAARAMSSASTTTSDNSLLKVQQPTETLNQVSHEIAASSSRMFAVIYVQGHQYKVTTNDLIQIAHHIPVDVGERIRLEKVLLVGGDNFTLLGRPLLGLDQVRVEATVIEKTISQKHIKYLWVKRSGFKKYKEFITKYTVLRINSIEVSPKLK
ncbi:large ribosomal subunit protein bL21m-like [Amphiura filiformis]|uniref:large ribosomal subunit protein bL21m-like n=1 Tax=Amphiura filiformis TaxID=82378 RepID=UPI003B213CB3